MKLAISVSGKTLDSPFDARFGRAAAFCILELDSGSWEAFDNPALSAPGGAGVQAAQFIAGHGAQAVISGAFGPKAFDTLSTAGITPLLAPKDREYSANEILSLYKSGALTEAQVATHEGHHGG